ncbi:MAG: permease, partial [Thermoplasmata archaeon]|nr:permease [Thermoplasmata archaeon]
MEFNIQYFIACIIIIYVIEAFFFGLARRHSRRVNDWMSLFSIDTKVPDRVKWWFMGLFGLGCIFLYTYCWTCEFNDGGGAGDQSPYLYWVFRNLLYILPWFVWGCIMAGIVMKFLQMGKLRLPRTMFGAGAFASIIPICSCAAVPMAHGMMLGRQMRVRAIVTFLIVVPVLSPVVYILALSQLGWEYLLVEIIAVFALAMVAGIIIEKLVGVKETEDPGGACYSCEGCKTAHMEKGRTSALLASWDQFSYLLKYILFGILIGAGIAVFVEPSTLTQLFGEQATLFGSLPGLVLIVLIAIPIFICSGEEVIILLPLLAGGLPLGHAIAFAIAGNAICITAVPVLNATFGKK